MVSAEGLESGSSAISGSPNASPSATIQGATSVQSAPTAAATPASSESTADDEDSVDQTAPRSADRIKPTKRTNVEDLRKALSALGLDIKGKKESLYKRLLKAFYSAGDARSERERTATPTPEDDVPTAYEARLRSAQDTWESFLCFDVEATCRGGREYDWPNEIIEFPVVLVQWVEDPSAPGGRRLEHVDTFHSYVQPTWQPKLTEFCIALTGITQETVDQSPKFPEMLKLLEQWLDKHELRDEDGRLRNALWVTDGPWDLRDFVPKQLFISPTNPPYPPYLFGQYLNIKQAVQTVMSELWQDEQAAKSSPSSDGEETPRTDDSADVSSTSASDVSRDASRAQAPTSPTRIIYTHKTMSKAHRETKYKGPGFYFPIPGQLEVLGLGPFEGRQHSGIDDATNVSRILIALSQKPGVVIEPNARTPHPKHTRRYQWMGSRRGVVIFEEWMSNPKAVLLEGKTYGEREAQSSGDLEPKVKGENVEWVLKQDASGRFVCVKEEVLGRSGGAHLAGQGEREAGGALAQQAAENAQDGKGSEEPENEVSPWTEQAHNWLPAEEKPSEATRAKTAEHNKAWERVQASEKVEAMEHPVESAQSDKAVSESKADSNDTTASMSASGTVEVVAARSGNRAPDANPKVTLDRVDVSSGEPTTSEPSALMTDGSA